MKKSLRAIFILFLLWTTNYGLWTANAAVPHLLNYQGRLTDSSGNPLNGSYALTFRIYDAETAGNLLWEEAQANVTIQKGIFSILLGSVTNLDLPFDKQYFLEIKVGNEVMSPRQRISSAGYAIAAENAEKLNSQDASYYKNASNINTGVLSVAQGGTGRNYKLSSAQTVGSTNISAPASATDMPDMNISITTTGTKLLCLFSAPIFGNSGGPTYAIFKLLIDGIEKCSTKVGTNSGTTSLKPVVAHMNWLESGLVPGSHTVKVRWYYTDRNDGGGVGQLGSSDGQRVLTVLELD